MNNNEFYVQQIKENCKWYFGHDVQVITFQDEPTGNWHVVVYPADCTLASASTSQIHLHGSAPSYLYSALYAVLLDIRSRIAQCFRLGSTGEAPVLLEQGAQCNCQQPIVSLPIAGARSESSDGVPELSSMEKETARSADPPSVSYDTDIPTGSSSPGAQASSAQDIWPAIQKIQSTLEVIQQQIHHRPVDTASPGSGRNTEIRIEQPDPAVYTQVQLVRQPVKQIVIARADVGGMPAMSLEEADKHTRELIREEISRAFAGAMSSLAGSAQTGAGV